MKTVMQPMNPIQRHWVGRTLAALALAVATTAFGQGIPSLINYQGRLSDTLGNPVSSGYYEIQFRLWDDATQDGAGNLVWGRSFPLHVVTNGLFNVLLSDGGGTVTTPTQPTATLLEAFNGPDRYLGLTITLSNGVSVVSSEISPRQQLASAPFAIHAQTSSSTLANSVGSDSLQNGSVTTAKIVAGSVTSGSLADGAVISGKIASGAVTAAKLNIDGAVHMNRHQLYLGNTNDTNHGVGYLSSLGGQAIDGAFVYGYQGGVLGTTLNGQKAALTWKSDQSVTANGALTADGALTANGALTATNSSVSMFGALQSPTKNTKHTATTDGFLVVAAYHRVVKYTIWEPGQATPKISRQEDHTAESTGSDFFKLYMPIAKGESWEVQDVNNPGGTDTYLDLYWRPVGNGD